VLQLRTAAGMIALGQYDMTQTEKKPGALLL
jgi:hypothetical protein